MKDRWGAFRHAGAMRLITRKASTAGVELPSSPLDPKCKACPTFPQPNNALPSSPLDPKCKACPAYHIKGMCNTGCGNVGDLAVHTCEQELPLWEWAVKAMPEITAPSAPVA